jgi:hypothetical protein
MRTILIAVVVMVSSHCGIAQAATIPWAISSGGNGHYYEVVISGEIDWLSAKAAAEVKGGYLATVTSFEENDFIYNMIATNPGIWKDTWVGPWLGGYQDKQIPDFSEPLGGWKWVTDEAWDYANWAVGQPNNSEDSRDPEDYLHFIGTDTTPSPYWNDLPSSENAPLGYVVEYDSQPVPEPTAILVLLSGIGAFGSVLVCKRQLR